MNIATNYQIAGTHYTAMGIQPIEFAMANQWDAGAFSTLKYLARHDRKNGLEDIQKGRHFVELRQQFINQGGTPISSIPMQRFVAENNIRGDTAWALMHLNRWVYDRHDADRERLLGMLDALIKKYRAGDIAVLR